MKEIKITKPIKIGEIILEPGDKIKILSNKKESWTSNLKLPDGYTEIVNGWTLIYNKKTNEVEIYRGKKRWSGVSQEWASDNHWERAVNIAKESPNDWKESKLKEEVFNSFKQLIGAIQNFCNEFLIDGISMYEGIYVYLMDWGQEHPLYFELQNWIEESGFMLGLEINGYEDLNENSKMVYDFIMNSQIALDYEEMM